MPDRKSAGASLSRRHSKARVGPGGPVVAAGDAELAERSVVNSPSVRVMVVSWALVSGGDSIVQVYLTEVGSRIPSELVALTSSSK
jgi:hypothetical protein